MGLGGRCRQGGQQRSLRLPLWLGEVAGLRFPVPHFPSLQNRRVSYPGYEKTPSPPSCSPPSPAQESFTGVWAGLVVTPWASYSLSREEGVPGKRERIWNPCPLTGQGAWPRDWGTAVPCSGQTHLCSRSGSRAAHWRHLEDATGQPPNHRPVPKKGL